MDFILPLISLIPAVLVVWFIAADLLDDRRRRKNCIYVDYSGSDGPGSA